MGRRIFLFLLTNLGVILTISVVTQLLGLDGYLTAQGINYTALLVFCSLWGIGGAFVSLALSKKMAKWMMKVQVIDPRRHSEHAELVQLVHRLSRGAGLETMPEVGIYPNPEVNAFATGPSKNHALIAVSTGLLQHMKTAEVEGVLGHEVAHIANGDMVTMTLIQGVVNAFTMFLARILAFLVSSAMRGDEDEGPSFLLQFGLVVVFDMFFTVLGSIVVAYFSRVREFRADAGGATLAGRDKMIAALEGLRRMSGQVDEQHRMMMSLKINGSPRGIAKLFMSHPPLTERITALRQNRVSKRSFLTAP